ncbi:MH1 domain protein, partial [Teladorsagia circumcincta]
MLTNKTQRKRFLRLMRGFDAEDVEVIRKAVESGGVDAKACAPGPPMDERPDDDQPEEDSGLIPQIDRPMSMPYLCCKLWRWKDLQVDAALHRLEALPWCRFGRVTINNATVSCCNPYHYALWIRPETSCSDEDSLRDSSQREVPMGNGHIAYRSHM